jgi:hypothetical protein
MGCMYVVVVRGQRVVRVLGKGSQAVWEGGGIDGPVFHVGRELPAAVQLDGQGRDKIGWGRGGWGVKVCGHVRGCVKPGWGFSREGCVCQAVPVAISSLGLLLLLLLLLA